MGIINLITNKGIIKRPNLANFNQIINAINSINTNLSDKKFFCSPNGSSSNDGLSLNSPVDFATALTLAGNSGNKIICSPGTYTGDYTITNLNLDIDAFGNGIGGLVNFTGTITIAGTSSSSSIRLKGITIANLIHNNIVRLYLNECNVNTSTVLSSNAYVEAFNTNFQGPSSTATMSITGSGNKNFNSNCKLPIATINNASAIVNYSNNLVSGPITLTAGLLEIQTTPIYAASTSTNAVSVSSAAILQAENVNFLNPDNTDAKISLASGSFYSFSNAKYSSSSTISGTNLGRIAVFDKLKGDGSLLTGLTKAQVGLGNVDNTADVNKNVLSATKLTTARTINGVSFDGSANINIATQPTPSLLVSTSTTLSANDQFVNFNGASGQSITLYTYSSVPTNARYEVEIRNLSNNSLTINLGGGNTDTINGLTTVCYYLDAVGNWNIY